MPEGHVIHRIARDQTKQFAGQKLTVLSPQGRFADGAKALSGRRLDVVEAYGKHLFYRFTGGKRLHVHLGLYGKFRSHPAPPPEPVGQVRLRAIGREQAFDLNGPNACHLVTKQEEEVILARLGPDPLRDDADPDLAWQRISRSRAAIGALLMNQEVIAGVGNIYRSEVLFLLGVHPETPGRELGGEQFDRLWEKLTELMEIGLRYNRIIIADPATVGKPRGRMSRSERLLVYKQDRCTTCQTKVKSWQLAARTIYACPKCQKR
ncbi:Endonuclease 8 1 [Posidoniimonas corsicana]|uniref:DNA-(apurinic or apyrimidinic site) lyase n=1 Tax=Posidoniimonas corsicana TaxID=1938618 RepID=A0A5C5VEP3_9BACT|nr:DNA-formamidopyrimidine glycosylase family protein [Posidoniimonas corsicana]TWT36175.1 Endonuclease 8 1 [Posidoniimonas corsicana]